MMHYPTEAMTQFALTLVAGLALAAAGCARPQSPPPRSAAPQPEAAPQQQEASSPASCPPVPYVKETDPLFLAFEDASNVYERLTLARLWVLVAEADPEGPLREARTTRAHEALAQAEQAVRAQNDPCVAGVVQALARVRSKKNQMEQRYLRVSDERGEASNEAKLLDAQVHLLRDEVIRLDEQAAPCQEQRMFQ